MQVEQASHVLQRPSLGSRQGAQLSWQHTLRLGACPVWYWSAHAKSFTLLKLPQ